MSIKICDCDRNTSVTDGEIKKKNDETAREFYREKDYILIKYLIRSEAAISYTFR